jgi:pimeloyl-ACP methyl ester carboxylesterase
MTDDFAYTGPDGWPVVGEIVGAGPLVIMLHGGGPDHRSMRPLAERLSDRYRVALPDIRGYGRSVCPDPALHRWPQYVDDLIGIMDVLGAHEADLVGAGLGGTVALRACLAHSARIRTAVIISVEDIENDEAKAAEALLMDRFAECVRTRGITAGWDLFLPNLQPLIAELVREAIPRADAASVAAAARIGHDRAFATLDELASITTPTLIIPGDDERHPTALAHRVADVMTGARVADVRMSRQLRDAEDMALAFAPHIRAFLHHPSAAARLPRWD